MIAGNQPPQSGDHATQWTGLLQWACHGWHGASPATDAAATSSSPAAAAAGHLRVGVRNLGPGRGRALVAEAQLAPGEVLLSVPLDRVFASEPHSPLYWAADMAVRLLKARHRAGLLQRDSMQAAAAQVPGTGAASSAGTAAAAACGTAGVCEEGGESAGPSGEDGQLDWGPWIRSLPAAVRTPLEYGEEEVRQLGCPYVVDEVRTLQRCLRDNYEAVRDELEAVQCGWEDFLWAVQVFHSRCFVEPGSGRHLCVPGVDMANHSAQPNAHVRIRNSPDTCQGYDATAEVAEPPPREPCRFELMAGEAGIRCGEEVTISYGNWPSEAFLLLFGFVPEPHPGGEAAPGCVPGEVLTLFGDAEEAVSWCLAAAASAQAQARQHGCDGRTASGAAGPTGAVPECSFGDAMRAISAALPEEEDTGNLYVTTEGVDVRLQTLLNVLAGLPGVVQRPGDALKQRVRERLSHFEVPGTPERCVQSFLDSKTALARNVLLALG